MNKKILLAAAGLFSVVVLGACSGSSSQEIATMKGGKITVEDFYNEAKKESTNQSLVRNMIIYKVFENAYGDKVTDKQIDKAYDEQKESLGDSFDSQLKSAGYTTKTFKAYLKQSLAFQEGLKAHVKITDKDLKTAWESFHPEVTARIIQASSEDDAKAIKKQLDDNGDFAKIAKEKSQDSATKADGGKIKFDSQTSSVPSEVKEAAFKLKNGEVSDVISTTDSSTYQTSYYIVKMEKTSSKGNDMDKYKKELKKIAEDTQMADQTFTSEVIAKELKKANVKIKDDSFENILSDFLTTNSSSSKKATSTSSSKKAESTSSTESSTEATDSSTASTDSSN